MIQTTAEIGNAKIHVTIHESSGWAGEIEGDMTATFCARTVEALDEWKQVAYTSSFTSVFSSLTDEEEDGLTDDGEIVNPDSFICILAALGEIGGEFSVTWEGESGFWFFHDLAHAKMHYAADGNEKEVHHPHELSEGMELDAHADAIGPYLEAGGCAEGLVVTLLRVGKAHERRFNG